MYLNQEKQLLLICSMIILSTKKRRILQVKLMAQR